MKTYKIRYKGRTVDKKQETVFNIMKDPVRKDESSDMLNDWMPCKIFNDCQQSAYYRKKLLHKIIAYLCEDLVMDLVDNGSIFHFPKTGQHLRCSVVEIDREKEIADIMFSWAGSSRRMQDKTIRNFKEWGMYYKLHLNKMLKARLRQRIREGMRYRASKELLS